MINYLNGFNFSTMIGRQAPINTACPDQLVGKLYPNGYISVNRQDIDYVNGTITNTLQNPLVIILESPHKDEFNALGNAIGPAMGATGNRFNTWFFSIVQNSNIYPNINHLTMDVIFVNAVQYQCSLGKPIQANKPLRDNNWFTCFNNGCNIDLIRRLNAIAPIAIINLCTIGNEYHSMQSTLDNYIIGNGLQTIQYTKGYHPSTWFSAKRRIID